MAGLGQKIATKAHKEGQAAFKKGKSQSSNPYRSNAPKGSDDWLKYVNWRNGWNFAYISRPITKRRRK